MAASPALSGAPPFDPTACRDAPDWGPLLTPFLGRQQPRPELLLALHNLEKRVKNMNAAGALLREAEGSETKTKLIAVLKVALYTSLIAATIFCFAAPVILGKSSSLIILALILGYFSFLFSAVLLPQSYYEETTREIEEIENLIPDNPRLLRQNRCWYNLNRDYQTGGSYDMGACLLGPIATLYHAFTKVARCRRVFNELQAEVQTASANFGNRRGELARDIANARGALDREAETLSSARNSLDAALARMRPEFPDLADAGDQTAYRLNAAQVEVNARRASWDAVAAFYAAHHLPEFG